MSRIKKLEDFYQEQLKDHKIDNVSDFIQSILDVDITKGKYARFLIEAFLNDKFLEEDLIGGLDSTVGQAISLFDKHKNKLPVEQRSVYALDKETGKVLYQSPGDLWNKVKQYQGELSGKELKKEEQEKIYRETEFVYKDEETGFQIVSPLTEEAAKWWGKGTRWCTSAENNNMFERYANISPLLILLIPDSSDIAGNGEKLQVWKNGNDIQFMDEADKSVSLDHIEQHWILLEPICLWLNDLRYIPDKYITKELCELAIKQNGKALRFIPEKYKTKELCELAIQQNGKALDYIPFECRTPELCLLAVKQNGLALYHVPFECRTLELCKMAIKQNGMALKYIPDEYRTKELYRIAVKNNGWALRFIPEKYKTKELCELAIQQNGNALCHIPFKYLTYELCELAVNQNGLALDYVPFKCRTKELCEMAIKQNGLALDYVLDEYVTKEMCDIAIRQNINAVNFVPEKHKVYTETYKLEYQQNKKEDSLVKSNDKYQITFQKLKEYFPKKSLSLNIK